MVGILRRPVVVGSLPFFDLLSTGWDRVSFGFFFFGFFFSFFFMGLGWEFSGVSEWDLFFIFSFFIFKYFQFSFFHVDLRFEQAGFLFFLFFCT